MDSSASAEVGDQSKEVRKIHFAVPSSAPTQLDPRQVEMIRRRRPTPATLFRVADQGTPEDDQSTHQWVVGENGVLKPKRVNPNVYQPPSLKEPQGTGTIDQSEAPDEEDEDEELEEDIVEENTEEKTEEEEKMEEKTEVKVEETVEEKGKKVRKSVKF